MKLWIVNHYSSIQSKDGWDARHAWLARSLVHSGWHSTLIAASVSHPAGVQRLTGWHLKKFEQSDVFDSLWVRVPAYRKNGFLRIIGMVTFGLLVVSPGFLRRLEKPDVVLGSTVHFFAALAALAVSKRFRVPFVFEVRDIWPDTLVDLGKLRSTGLLSRLMRRVSRFLAKEASLVISPLPGIGDYLGDLGVDNVRSLWVPNGTEPSLLQKISPPGLKDTFVFMYLGSQGNTNELDLLVDAFDLLVCENPQIKTQLRIIGEGPKKQALGKRIAALKSGRQIFLQPSVSRPRALQISQSADCMLLLAKPLNVYRYGVSPNKLFDYFLSGRPVIMSAVDPYHSVASVKAGVEVRPDDVGALSKVMLSFIQMSPEEVGVLGRNGRIAAEGIYSYSFSAQILAEALDSL